MYEPASEGDATYWDGSPEETAGELAAFLRDEGVVSS
jgi:electron transfer flavoprotein beta subunit